MRKELRHGWSSIHTIFIVQIIIELNTDKPLFFRRGRVLSSIMLIAGCRTHVAGDYYSISSAYDSHSTTHLEIDKKYSFTYHFQFYDEPVQGEWKRRVDTIFLCIQVFRYKATRKKITSLTDPYIVKLQYSDNDPSTFFLIKRDALFVLFSDSKEDIGCPLPRGVIFDPKRWQ